MPDVGDGRNPDRREEDTSDTDVIFVADDYLELCSACVCCFFVIAVCVALAFYFLYRGKEDDRKLKYHANYTTLLQKSVTWSLRPCDNFYKFVCGGWIKDSEGGPSSLVDGLERNVFLNSAQALDLFLAQHEKYSPRQESKFHAFSYPLMGPQIIPIYHLEQSENYPSSRRDRDRQRTPEKSSAVIKAASMFKHCRSHVLESKTESKKLTEFLRQYTLFPAAEHANISTITSRLVELSLTWKVHVLYIVDVFADHDENGKPTLSLRENAELQEWPQLRTLLVEKGKLKDFLRAHLDAITDLIPSQFDDLFESIVQADSQIIPSLLTDTKSSFASTYQDLPHVVPGTENDTWLTAVNKQTKPYFMFDSLDYVKVENKEYFLQVGKIISNQKNRPQLLLFLGWHILRQLAPRASYKASQALHKDQDSLYVSCFEEALLLMPLAATQPFLSISPTARAQSLAAEITKDVRSHMGQLFGKAPWMNDSTKDAAISKISAIKEVWVRPKFANDEYALNAHYANFSIYPDYFTTWTQSSRFATEAKMKVLASGETVDNYMFQPIEVNAFYERPFNAMFIPGGIIRPPYADENLPRAFNYAGLGAVVGHEIAHGFDERGKYRDANGKLTNWWTPEVERAYNTKVACVQDAYNSEPSVSEENVADFASLPAVLNAFLARTLRPETREVPDALKVFSKEKIFYLNYCFKLCSRNQRAAPGYPTDEDRCNVPLSHLDNFAETFGCQSGDPMISAKRCDFWEVPIPS